MNPVVVDASALAALAFAEPSADVVARRLHGATVFAPTLLRFELANTAWKKISRQPAEAARILAALDIVLSPRWGIGWRDVDPTDVVLIARASGLTAYDASYLWLAGTLDADLVTLDKELASVLEA